MYEFYSDPGHGWLKVPRDDLVELNIEEKITPYSYMSCGGRVVYLEEDCDLSTYARAKGCNSWSELSDALGGISTINIEDNRVRNLPSYRPNS